MFLEMLFFFCQDLEHLQLLLTWFCDFPATKGLFIYLFYFFLILENTYSLGLVTLGLWGEEAGQRGWEKKVVWGQYLLECIVRQWKTAVPNLLVTRTVENKFL
jgi:hypothetical protein